MNLKKLELYGFKSFADRTVFEFEDGLSALVGPNGAGKSNVADALKWVLGERSARKLRGSEMANIIFGGSKSRKPLNYAEVTLTIDNSDGWLDIDYDEVAIRRRVDRSGQSEYYLNGRQCRLKDISGLLMDTGVGTTCYSFIEQGQIDELLRANPTERRAVFEEAAGINRFLDQKRQAERKLDRVTNNLARVSDIVEEVERQLRSVKYQAGRARTFKRQTEQLQKLRLAHSLHLHRTLQSRRAEVSERLEEALAEKSRRDEAVRTTRNELESARADLQAARDELSRRRQRLTRVEARLESLEREIQLNQRRCGELDQQLQEANARKGQLRERAGELEEEIEDVRRRVAESTAGLEEVSERLEKKRQEADRVRDEIRRMAQQVEARKAETFDLFERESRINNQLEVIAAEKKTLKNRLERTKNRRAELGNRLEAARAEREDAAGRLETLRGEQEELTNRMSELRRQVSEAAQRQDELSEKINDVRGEFSGKNARRDVLLDLEERAEGVGAGTRYLLEAEPPGLLGMLARLLEVPFELAPAVEAVLDDHAQALVLRDAEGAHEALRMLEDRGEGRAELIVLACLHRAAPADPPEAASCRGRLSEMVDCNDAARPVVDRLLGNAFLVDDEDSARAILAAGLADEVCLVTRGGQRYGGDGVWAGGAAEKAGLVSRRSELTRLESAIEDLEARLAALGRQREEGARKLRALNGRKEDLTSRIQVVHDDAGDARSHLAVAERRVEQLEEELQVSEAENADCREDLEELDRRETALKKDSGEASRQRAAAEEQVQQEQQSLADLREREQEIGGEVSSLNSEVARTRERHHGLKDLQDRLGRDLEDVRRRLEQLGGESDVIERRRLEAERAAAEAREKIEQRREEKERLTEALEGMAGSVQEAQRRISDLTERAQSLAAGREEAEEKIQGLRVRQNELKVKMEDLLERTAEDYGVRLRALELEPEQWKETSPFLNRQIREWAAKEPAPAETVADWYRATDEEQQETDEEAELVSLEEVTDLRAAVLELADSPETDWQEVKKKISTLKAKVDRIGNVNVAAIRQQEELEVRLQFLTDQKEDLEKGRRHEREIIRELNKKSRERFAETFEAVRQNFQALFRKLFGGGTADLRLDEEAEDILEAGIDIMARPPGKETNSITLLSGGEKALTTIALLFAIFQSKPSPFCVLDEVDAPLDDSNVERFLKLLEEFRRETQFIVVTHNKLSMSVAQVLYGVTMTDGVTQKMSVRFEDVDESLTGEPEPRAKAG